MNTFVRLVLMSVIACSLACSGNLADQPAPTTAPGKKVDLATAGSLTGIVRFDGTPPGNEILRLATDKHCVQNAGPNPQSDAILVAGDGALKNVFVYVKSGLDAGYVFDAPTGPVVLNQQGCIYSPRVLGVRVGQSIEIVNGDATLHNVHALPMANQEFNKSQPKINDRMTAAFTAPEVMVRFKCDVHGWMAAHVGVVEHPYFAVSDAAGQFDIKNLPPGTYTLEAWHEKFGRTTASVTVAEKQAQTVAFSFSAASK